MILGRNTQQWLGLIASLLGVIQTITIVAFPAIDPATVGVVLGSVGVFLGAFIAFLANTATTPTSDPQLKAGTMIRVTDESGTVVGHTPVPEPSPPPKVRPSAPTE